MNERQFFPDQRWLEDYVKSSKGINQCHTPRSMIAGNDAVRADFCGNISSVIRVISVIVVKVSTKLARHDRFVKGSIKNSNFATIQH